MGLAGGQHEKRLEIYFLETIPFTFFSEELPAQLSFLQISLPPFDLYRTTVAFPTECT